MGEETVEGIKKMIKASAKIIPQGKDVGLIWF